MNCSEIMTRNPTCCLPTDSAYEAARLMKSEDVGPIPICEDRGTKKLVGIVTDRDLALKVVAEARDPKNTKLKEVMTSDLYTCGADDDLDKALELMQEHQIRRIPVVDNKDHLIGIIAQADLATRAGSRKKTGEVVKEISH
jgi:CBS-domain-containing membrane protein